MKKSQFLNGPLACAALAILCNSTAMSQDRKSEFDEKYGVISERNIFLRERSKPREPTTRETTRPTTVSAPESPEKQIILRGVVIEDNEFRAYFEKVGGGMLRVAPGEALAMGTLAEIVIDAVAYEQSGHIKWIEIGQNLEGTRQKVISPVLVAPTTAQTATPGASAEVGTSGATPPASGGSLSVEERMRLRKLNGGK